MGKKVHEVCSSNWFEEIDETIHLMTNGSIIDNFNSFRCLAAGNLFGVRFGNGIASR